ncbi:MAG: mannose-1-phosphate guanyltransferase [Hirschia sp.]|nr:mannose-1-phosphate guanyltransferase [Hirschia sp.]MBF17189.1 mannose-1-phosphate guanyltransferase [Hirschia sp.]
MMKEAVQMRRDRMTFGMMLVLPVMQLILFGYAINTDPHSLPTAIQMEEDTPITRSIISGLEVSGYYAIVERTQSDMESDSMLARGDVSFVVTIPKGFTKRLLRGETPQLLIEADASDPSASSNAISRAQVIVQRALAHELYKLNGDPQTAPPLFELVIHPKYNPAAVTQYNIVPGLLGVILTMTMVMMTSLAMTRETEQGTMENLLAMPARPIEVMLGKISPYVIVGAVQTLVVLAAAIWVFKVPFLGSFWVLSLGVVIFVIANLAVGFSFSTFARSQMQAMQMTFFFFLPSLLLSGFMFPFRGMPNWAQMIGEILPLTHFLRIVRGTMLKGADLHQLQPDINAMLLFTLFMGAVAMVRYRQTLD